MRSVFRLSIAVATGLATCHINVYAEPQAKDTKKSQSVPAQQLDTYTNISLFDAMKSGEVVAHAEGTGDGRMRLTMQNNSKRKLRVILPPGLIASGASG
ncbi:MAG: hypothetical protein ACKO0V_00845, partial [bacterium]